MPELPEVETQVRDLQKIVGHKILAVESDTRKSFRPNFATAEKMLVGRKILAVRRRAKFLVFELSNATTLVAHFRMTGHFLIADSAEPLEKFIRHVFKLSGGIWLQFSDIRKFGTLAVCSAAEHESFCGLDRLGPEPLDREFTLARFRKIVASRRGGLKSLLLDQTFVAGVGNIYADEICFGSRLHPLARVEKLTDAEVKRLHAEIKKQLKKGVRNRGTTIGEYVDASGRGGSNQKSLRAYKRHGLPCLACGSKMQKIKVSQRTTTFCPKCQPPQK